MMETRLRRVAAALLAAGGEEDAAVREQLRRALSALGAAEPEETLECCAQFLRERPKLPLSHRSLVLLSMAAVIRERLPDLPRGAALAALALASQELTRTQEGADAAAAVLVALCPRFLGAVMEELLRKFPPGILPHPAVLRTFGSLATAHVFGMVPFLNSILGTLIPLLPAARADPMKCTICEALQRFSEAALEYLAGPGQGPDPTVRGDGFGNELGAAFETLSQAWIHSRNPEVRVCAVAALGALSALLPAPQLQEQLPRVLPALLALQRRHALPPLPLAKSLAQLLHSWVAAGGRGLEPLLEPLLPALLAQICAPADPDVDAKNRAELLRCFSVLAVPFPDRLLAFLAPRLEGGSGRGRAGALLLLRHLLNCAPSQMEPRKSFILSSLRLPLHDSDPQVRRALVQLIGAMAPRGFLQPPAAEPLLEFLLRQCALPAQTTPGIPEGNPEDADDVRSVSVSTLLLLSTAVDSVGPVLWPFLLRFVLPPDFSAALTPLCRSLSVLAAKFPPRFPLERDAGNLPSPQALTVRLLAVSSRPFLAGGRGAAALSLLGALRPHPALAALLGRRLPALLRRLRENSEHSLNQREWEGQLLQLLQDSLSSIPDPSWISSLVSESLRQLRAAHGCPEQDFLFLALGSALGRCPEPREPLRELLASARCQRPPDRELLARCLGICARRRPEEALEALEEFGNSEALRKTPGLLLSIFRDRGAEAEQDKLRAALALCYGRVAAAAPEPQRSQLLPRLLPGLLRLGRARVLGIKVETKDAELKLSLARSISMIGRALARGSDHCRDPWSDPESDHCSDHWSDHESDHWSDPESDHESDHEKDPESDHEDPESDHKSDLKSDPWSDHRNDPWSDHRKDTRTDHRSDHRKDPESDPGNDHRSDHTNDHGSDPRSDHRNDRGSDRGSDPMDSPGSDPEKDPRNDHGNDPRNSPGSDPRNSPRSDPRSDPKSDHNSDPWKGPGSDHWNDHGGDPRSDPGSDPRSDPGSDPRSDHWNDHGGDPRSDPGSDPRSDHWNDRRSDRRSDHRKGPGARGCGSIAHKAELVALMVEFLRAEPPDSLQTRLRQRAIGACARLVALEPPLAEAEREQLLETALGATLGLPPGQEQELLRDALRALRELLRELLRRRLHPEGLLELLQHLAPWMESRRDEESERALALGQSLLEFFLRQLRVCSLCPFSPLAPLVALLAPLCCDAAPGIGARARRCLRALLRIHGRYLGFSPDHRDPLLEELQNPPGGSDGAAVANVLAQRVPPEQLPALLPALLEPGGNRGRGAAAEIGTALLESRGHLLRAQVPALLGLLRSRLELEPGPARRGLVLLGLRHPWVLLGALLDQRLPLDGPTCAVWRALGSEPALSAQILEQLLELLDPGIPEGDGKFRKTPGESPEWLAAACALPELLAAPGAAPALRERFPRLFRNLLLLLGRTAGTAPRTPRERPRPEPGSSLLRALRSALSVSGCAAADLALDNSGGWERLGTPGGHREGTESLAGAMARLCAPRLPPVVRSLLPVLGEAQQIPGEIQRIPAAESQRITAAAFLAELPRHRAVSELALLEPLLEALLAARERDPSARVRALALRGLGNAADAAPEQIRRHGARLLAALVCALDAEEDSEDVLALEAMAGLSRVLERLEEREARPALLRVAIRIRPFFDSARADLRRSSFLLLAALARGAGPAALSEPLLGALLPLLLHLRDPDPGAAQACTAALRAAGPGLGCSELQELFGKRLRDPRGLHYGEFLNCACKSLVRSLPSLLPRSVSTALFYCRSPWPELRAAAALLAGFLVLHADEERGRQLDLDQLISALQPLLQDPDPAVRLNAAESLGRLVRLL